jgi:uncharacterized heparinase superfamily protein
MIFQSILASSSAGCGVRTWKAGGYTVIRTRPLRPIVLTIDHGPLGYLSIAAHGHADALALWLSIGSDPVIVDGGTYLYHSDPIWRGRFQSTAVHNTLCIAGRSSSQASGPFNWKIKANAQVLSVRSKPRPRLVVEHDGYLKRFGVRHRRTIESEADESIVIIDELIGSLVSDPVAISFLINPNFQVVVDVNRPNIVIVTNNFDEVIQFTGNEVLCPRIVRGDQATGLGWVSPSYGVRVPADQVLFEGCLNTHSIIRIDVLDRSNKLLQHGQPPT